MASLLEAAPFFYMPVSLTDPLGSAATPPPPARGGGIRLRLVEPRSVVRIRACFGTTGGTDLSVIPTESKASDGTGCNEAWHDASHSQP